MGLVLPKPENAQRATGRTCLAVHFLAVNGSLKAFPPGHYSLMRLRWPTITAVGPLGGRSCSEKALDDGPGCQRR